VTVGTADAECLGLMSFELTKADDLHKCWSMGWD
jgi:hypothetical protein